MEKFGEQVTVGGRTVTLMHDDLPLDDVDQDAQSFIGRFAGFAQRFTGLAQRFEFTLVYLSNR